MDFETWLKNNDYSYASAGRAMKRPTETIRRWAQKKRRPRGDDLDAIEAFTNYQVTANDFYSRRAEPDSIITSTA